MNSSLIIMENQSIYKRQKLRDQIPRRLAFIVPEVLNGSQTQKAISDLVKTRRKRIVKRIVPENLLIKIRKKEAQSTKSSFINQKSKKTRRQSKEGLVQ